MVLTNKDAGIFKLKIDIGEHFEVNNEDLYVVLREPTTQEALTLSTGENNQNKIFELMPTLIVEHSFESAPEKKMTSKEVWSLIMKRPTCATDIVEEWSQNIPLAKRKLEKSEE